MAGAETVVRATLSEGVARVALDDPSGIPRLNRATITALGKLMAAFERNTEIFAVVVTGTEKCFAAGADLSEVHALTGCEARRFSALGQSLMERLERFPRPVVAAVRGYCLGGGFDLAMACHLRVAAQDAVFGHPGGAGAGDGMGRNSTAARYFFGVGRARARDRNARDRAADYRRGRLALGSYKPCGEGGKCVANGECTGACSRLCLCAATLKILG